jgi:hypothetical protein
LIDHESINLDGALEARVVEPAVTTPSRRDVIGEIRVRI